MRYDLKWALSDLDHDGFVTRVKRLTYKINEKGLEMLESGQWEQYKYKRQTAKKTTELPKHKIDTTEDQNDEKSDLNFDDIFLDQEQIETILELISIKKNVIFQGPPGVGKTYIAKKLANKLTSNNPECICYTQFHQTYSYEDFVMGYRPTENGFKLKTGPFYNHCKLAEKKPDQNFVYIIDEINRGNISKIFGEMMVCLESDKRGEKIKLIYSEEEFAIPDNLYIIGMMNSADRSIAMMDYALRRRFAFFNIEPAFNTIKFKNIMIQKGMAENKIEILIQTVNELNEIIKNDPDLGPGFQIGHSYFCNYSNDEKWYSKIIQYEIKPLLEEYWFDDSDKLNLALSVLDVIV